MKKINTGRTRAYAATTLAMVLVAAACGGENNADPPATSAAVPNTTPSTILPLATDPAPTTTTTPTTTPTTAAPTTSTTTELNEEERAKQAVVAAAQNAWYLFNEAKLDPTNKQKVEAALAAQTGDARFRVEQIVDQYVALNQRSRTLDSAPSWVDIDENSVHVDVAAGTASLELCHLNSNTLIESAGEAGGADIVIDDHVVAYHTSESYVRVAGAWLKSDGAVLEEFDGALTCGHRR